MDTANGSRRGRPPAPVPTMPLFLGAARTRVKEEITMSASVARELRAYVDWASGLAMMPDDEVLVRTIDHALAEYFKNDRAWQKDRNEVFGGAGAASKLVPVKTETASPGAGGKSDLRSASPAAATPGKGG
jgi:hypothetical protein